MEEKDEELTDATLRIASLEHELEDMRRGSKSREDSSLSDRLQSALDIKEEELSRLQANERVNAASKEALNAQVDS